MGSQRKPPFKGGQRKMSQRKIWEYMVEEVGREQDRQVSGMSTEQSFREVPGLEGVSFRGSVRSGADREIHSR